jgi:CRP/FNR family transcriptional regulator, cyclic AMP receptor protein
MSTVIADEDLLRSIPLFAKLSTEDRNALATLLKPRQFSANQPVFWIGERGEDMFIVQYGKVRLSYTDEAGRDVTLAQVGPGAFFGELSILDGGPRTATARTATETTLLSLDRGGFYDFIEKHPAAALHIIATLGHRQRENLDRLRGVGNVNEQVEQQTTPLQRLVDRAAAIAASGRFLIGVLIFLGVCIIVQTFITRRYRPDLIHASGFPVDSPPYFFWLGFMVGLVSFLLTIFVLNSQRRQAERDRIRADMEYQVNLKAQLEIMQLHQKMDRLAALMEKNGKAANESPG